MDITLIGLRDPRQAYEKPPEVLRILLFGGSYVEAARVQAEQSISMVLERQLTSTLGRLVEVLNGGVFGYGTAQDYLLLDLRCMARHRGRAGEGKCPGCRDRCSAGDRQCL